MTGRRPAAAGVLRRALAAEQAATYGYGVLGAHLSGAEQSAATADWTAHQEAAASLAGLLTALGLPALPAAAAYQLPGQVNSAAQARSLAVLIEDRACAAYIGVVGLTETSVREFGARQLRACAVRAAAWRGSTVAFPGLAGAQLTGAGLAATRRAATPPAGR